MCVLKSGVHATLAGVATALAVPLAPAPGQSESTLERLELALGPWVRFGVLPLFAFANAGVSLAGLDLAKLAGAVTTPDSVACTPDFSTHSQMKEPTSM